MISHRPLIFAVSVLALTSLSLGGCTSMRRALGLEKVVPDEFAVVSRAPLAIPPDFALRPPRPGAPPTQETSPTEQAKQTIFRAGDQQPALPGAEDRSPGENELLKQAGAANASPDIRQTITQEAREATSPVDESFVDKLLFWRSADSGAPPVDAVIDPQLEAQHLKDAKAAASASPTPPGMAGAPTIERVKEPSILPTL